MKKEYITVVMCALCTFSIFYNFNIQQNALSQINLTQSDEQILEQKCEKFNTSKENETPLQIIPTASLSPLFSSYPSLDYAYFSPGSSIGLMDEVKVSYTAAQNLNYMLNATAMPRPINIADSEDPYFLYVNEWAKTYVFYTTIVYASPMYITLQMGTSLDMGETWDNFTEVSPRIYTSDSEIGSPVVTNFFGTLFLLYRVNQTIIYCQESTDQGLTWSYPEKIQKGTIEFDADFPGRLDIASDYVNGYIQVVASTAKSTSSSKLYFFNYSISTKVWTDAVEIPFTTTANYMNPTIGINSTGTIFLTAVNQSLNNQGFLAIFKNGLWNTPKTQLLTGDGGFLTFSIDNSSDDFILYNRTQANPNNIKQFWISPNVEYGDFNLITTGWASNADDSNVRLCSYKNKPFFVTAGVYSGITTVAYERIIANITIASFTGSTLSGDSDIIPFNGSREEELSPYFYFNLDIRWNNGSTWSNVTYMVQRDDLKPVFSDLNFNEYISPENNDGILDNLQYNFTVSEDGDYSFQVFQENSHNITESVVSSSISNKYDPKIVMDQSGRIYAFYLNIEGGSYRLLYQISDNGGLTWDSPVALTLAGYNNDEYSVGVDQVGIYVATRYQPYYAKALLRSVDGGDTWTIVPFTKNIVLEQIIVSNTGTLFAPITPTGLSTPVMIGASGDSGRTWKILQTIDTLSTRIIKMGMDERNERLYIVHQNSTAKTYELFNIDLKTKILTNFTLFSSQNPFRGFINDFKISPSIPEGGNSTIQFQDLTSPDGSNIFEETWISYVNGTSWIRLSNESSVLVTSPYGFYFNAKTNTTLYCTIETIDSVNTVILRGESRMVYREAGRFNRNDPYNIDYDGKDFNGQYLAPDQYSSKLTVWDCAKNSIDEDTDFIIDRESPLIYNINWTATPANPLPTYNVNITFDVSDPEAHLASVAVSYRHSNGGWTSAVVQSMGGTKYNTTILGLSNSEWLQFYVSAVDLAGNTYAEDNNNSYFGWNDPTIQGLAVPLTEEISVYDSRPIQVVFIQGLQYIDRVYINTSYGVIMNLTYNESYYIGDVPVALGLDSFTYQVIYRDLWGRESTIFQDTHSRPEINGNVFQNVSNPNAYDDMLITTDFGDSGKYIQNVCVNITNSDGIITQKTFSKVSSRQFICWLSPPTKTQGYTYQVYWIDLGNRTSILKTEVLQAPTILVAQMNLPETETEITTVDMLEFQITFADGVQKYIQNVYVNYSVDNGEWRMIQLDQMNGTFSTKLSNLNVSRISYYLEYEDITGNFQKIEGSEQTHQIIPAMPTVLLSESESLLLIIIAAIIGTLIGILYSISLRNHTKDPTVTYTDAFRAKKSQVIKNSKNTAKTESDISNPDQNKTLPLEVNGIDDLFINYHPKTYSIFALSFIIFLDIASVVGWWYYQTQQSFEIATTLSGLTFLLTTFVFESFMETTAEIGIRNKKRQYLLYLVSLLFLLGALLTLTNVFWTGAKIQWFRYYIYEDSNRIGDFVIPTLWISVASTFFTSMLYVVISTILAVKKVDLLIRGSYKQGTRLYDLFIMREKEITSIKQYIMFKTLAFIVLVTFAVISATNLSKYSGIGLILLIPFILMSLLMIVIFGSPRKRKQTSNIQELTKCGTCGNNVPNGSYCNVCGSKIILGNIETVSNKICPACNAQNEPGAKFCWICGLKF